jgi:L-threonylcarbamoyladenylate synthase
MREIAAAFAAGRLIAIPTETVYGLAAPINRPDLIERIFELKGRPASNPLIVHVASIDQARGCVAQWPRLADHLAHEFWPGPLTLVLPRSSLISDRVTAGQPTVALRMPEHPLALALIKALDCPVVAPSANRFTRLSPTAAADVAEAFDEQAVLVLDGGRCRIGIESSIVALDESSKRVRLLRPGQIDRATIERSLLPGWQLVGPDDERGNDGARAPGNMRIHYRPSKPLRVTVVSGAPESARLKVRLRGDPTTCLVELDDQADKAARSLYASLRDADRRPGVYIDIVIPAAWQDAVAWEGVLNRLKKAASSWRNFTGENR